MGGNGTIEDLREIDGTIYSPLEKFPGGFTPRFFGDITDYSFAAGLKGMTGSLGYDISGRYGYYEISAGDAASVAVGPHSVPDPFGFCSREDIGYGLASEEAVAAALAAGMNCANTTSATDDDDNPVDGFEGIDPTFQAVGVGSNGFPC